MLTPPRTLLSPVSAPCIRASGPTDAKIMLIGEAPGAEEERLGLPFVGQSGQELRRMMEEAGLNPDQCYMTNVLWTRPPANKFAEWLVGKAELPPDYPSITPVQRYPKIGYLPPELLPELERLVEEVNTVKPNVIVALGATALWATTGLSGGIGKIRGTVVEGIRKILPTYHPAAILRKWDDRPLVVADLAKALRQSGFPEIRRPRRELWVEPSIADIQRWIDQELYTCPLLSVDTETRNGQITEIGFASRRDLAIVIPFVRDYKDHYWSERDEILAWKLVRYVLEYPVPKLFQNGLYDLQYILRAGIRPHMTASHDTMLFHHALYPEMAKGLGHLGSIYTDEPAWKLLRQGAETMKRDDE